MKKTQNKCGIQCVNQQNKDKRVAVKVIMIHLSKVSQNKTIIEKLNYQGVQSRRIDANKLTT